MEAVYQELKNLCVWNKRPHRRRLDPPDLNGLAAHPGASLIISQRHRPLANEFVHGDPAWGVAHSQDCIGLPWLPDSNFVDCTTGRSVGDAPLRFRPTYMPIAGIL
jgi:hypothetical protein